MTEYRPIDCGLHSRYEVAILHRQRLRVSWCEPGGQPQLAELLPVDLYTRDGEEFLQATRADGTPLALRLDYIRHADPL